MKPGETVPQTCTDLDTGLLVRLYDLPCTTTLALEAPQAFERKLLLASRKADYISDQAGRYLSVCDTPDISYEFAKAGTMLRLTEKRRRKCPFFDHQSINVRLRIVYKEQTNPFNVVQGEDIQDKVWTPGTSLSATLTASVPGNPFAAYGTSGEGSATITVDEDDPDPNNPCTSASSSILFHWNSFGAAPNANIDTADRLTSGGCSGDSVVGVTKAAAFGGTYYPPGDPIGLVMGIEAYLTFLSYNG